jgi:hypothetical protein
LLELINIVYYLFGEINKRKELKVKEKKKEKGTWAMAWGPSGHHGHVHHVPASQSAWRGALVATTGQGLGEAEPPDRPPASFFFCSLRVGATRVSLPVL